jgi:hypothetical protein
MDPHCTVWIKTPEATFELAVLLVKPLHATVIPYTLYAHTNDHIQVEYSKVIIWQALALW